MHDRDMRQIDLATKTGIRQGTISHYVAGRLSPKSDAIEKLSRTLGVSELWLMGYDVPMSAEADQDGRNQIFAEVVLRMQSDPEFRRSVELIGNLAPEELSALITILGAMKK